VRLGTAPRYLGAVRRSLALLLLATLPAGCGGGDKPSEPLPEAARSIAVTSPAFRDGGSIPKRFSCDGEESSPPLRWSGVPARARELALVVEDPDADRFVHWTVLHIPATATGIPQDRVPSGAIETENSFGKSGWGGPCPPEGDDPHRYVFALYATDAPLGLGKDSSPDDVRAALSDHAIARGTLTGRFGR
jgi:Raf kinase inhibitor-like YbhB/YbcL family protein